MSTTSNKIEHKSNETDSKTGLTLRIVSFGYKLGKPPSANALFDVRFLKNPYWVDHLRPMTGKDLPVQEYVMNQKVAQDFLDGLIDLLNRLIPQLKENSMAEFHIAFGCTGGQHRSATMVELLAKELAERFPDLTIERVHRELDGKSHVKHDGNEDSKSLVKHDGHDDSKSHVKHAGIDDGRSHAKHDGHDDGSSRDEHYDGHDDGRSHAEHDGHDDGKSHAGGAHVMLAVHKGGRRLVDYVSHEDGR